MLRRVLSAAAFGCAFVLIGCGASPNDPAATTTSDAPSSLSVGETQTCVVDAQHVASCTGKDGVSVRVPLDAVVEIAAGNDHACARRDDGSVWCWGKNAFGQLGDGTREDRATPVRVAGVAAATSIAAGFARSCATTAQGALFCWGVASDDPHATLEEDAPVAATPAKVDGIDDAIAVTLGAFHACALGRDGGVSCFGANYYGQLGDGTTDARDVAAKVAGVTHAIAIAAGTHHTCAIVATGAVNDGDVVCWGGDVAGQLGAPASPDGMRLAPAKIAGVHHARALAAGGDHTCVIDTRARCWGWNDVGQVARGAEVVVRTPTAPSGTAGIVAIAASSQRTCGAKPDGTLACWGE